ncbi:alpha-glucosidase/alpha-galactosidase [Brachybacterium saurashtrense]|uniref:Alpha-glucosidase/alpha-galactosidase n=1 Tax=Brachybacterium saurashtrense TaxID=556288 RepID=A0A345YT04_9MICO|nr:alpha-glucosidase/alpha-galactosidase [Brachybacterium saurashtrense]AXK47056.1 alpha-glucosidase/alpha-galactosidase [Brachybacterium saurashtrense]RRR20905.1 alpha-glucosidase/alpha-galactosidase [Brachybacterium saurashtrense]
MATTHLSSPKITLIGAGGFVFPFRLIGDILSFPALRGATLTLMDIDPDKLGPVASATRDLIAHHGFDAVVEETTDRRAALDGADVVIITFQVGGVESYRHDVEIPRRYGIDQTVGDTVGPGGVFRFLRSVPAYDEIAADALEVCPEATFINYANPMAMATAYLNAKGLHTVGLCHSVQGTTRMLARTLGVPYEEVSYRCAGINHQAWILEFQRGQEDLYPQVREVMAKKHQRGRGADGLAGDDGDHSGAADAASTYEGGNEQVRTSIMNAFGYFQTESSHHASEYLPYFRKTPELVEEFIPERWDYYEICVAHDDQGDIDTQLERLKAELAPSVEYGASIVNSLVTGTPSVVHGNVPNRGALIANLPDDACVEVPCLVDARGVQPTAIGDLPPQLAALNRTNVNVQTLAVRAALAGEVEHVHHAVALDPLTAAQLTLEDARAMTEELLAAHADRLPQRLQVG